jgi:hypothetical protein
MQVSSHAPARKAFPDSLRDKSGPELRRSLYRQRGAMIDLPGAVVLKTSATAYLDVMVGLLPLPNLPQDGTLRISVLAAHSHPRTPA